MPKSAARSSARRSSARRPEGRARRILAIDIGATGLKAAVISPRGAFLTERGRIKTPHPCPPAILIAALEKLVAPLGRFDCVTIGFPGYVKRGKVVTAPNLGTGDWAGFALESKMARKLGKPVKLRNDADVQGLAVIKGRGLELVATLGTGLGTAWFRDGELMPHMELAHMPIHHGKDFDAYIGDEERKKIGDVKWNRRVEKVLAILDTVLNYDHLYIGGGNSRRVRFKLPPHVTIVSNDAGMAGGAFVWHGRGGSRGRGT
jgi:polyphosphate glucokinase